MSYSVITRSFLNSLFSFLKPQINYTYHFSVLCYFADTLEERTFSFWERCNLSLWYHAHYNPVVIFQLIY